jgi:hypothetical protein
MIPADNETYRPLFDSQGGAARAFECRMCPHELSDKARCFAAGKRRPGRYVTASFHGIKIHLNRVHGVKSKKAEEFECCGCEGCGFDCGCLCS